MDELKKNAILEIQKCRLQVFLQNIKHTHDLVKMALRGTFLLNGAAIIPILYAKSENLYNIAWVFGLGVMFSVLATCLSYISQYYYTLTWRIGLFTVPFHKHLLREDEDKLLLKAKDRHKIADIALGFTVFLLLASIFAFCIGLILIKNFL